MRGSKVVGGKLRVMQRRGFVCVQQSPLAGFCVLGSTSCASSIGWSFFFLFYHFNNCELFIGGEYQMNFKSARSVA